MTLFTVAVEDPVPKLIRCWLFLLLTALAASAAAAEGAACPPEPSEPTPEAVRVAMEQARDRGFLWRITKGGRTSYLYGTIHVASLDWMFPGPRVAQALHAVDTIALELDMLDPNIQRRIAKRLAELRSPALPPELAQRMRKQMAALCIPPEAVDKVIPELQVAALVLYAVRHEGLDASFGIDAMLAGYGRGAQKRMTSLETPETQLDKLQMPTPEDTSAFVRDALDDLESDRGRNAFIRLSNAWANADYASMERFGDWCECLTTEIDRKAMRRLLDERNPGMANRIDAMHRSGKQVFAAVGSLHMFGEVGLPRLMEKRGYRVERVGFGADKAAGGNGATGKPGERAAVR